MTEKKDLKKAHETKVKAKARKPKFTAQDSQKKKRIKKAWRKPNGSDSKMRVSFRGYRQIVRVGFGSSSELRGVSKKGYKIVKIASLNELKELIAKKEKTDFPVGLEISSSIGKKTKVEIVELALKNKIHILSVRKPEEFLKSVETEMKARKDKRTERSEKIKAKEKESKKKDKKDEKGDLEQQLDKDVATDDKKQDKKEKDKVLAKGE